jgi:hypothetical protein
MVHGRALGMRSFVSALVIRTRRKYEQIMIRIKGLGPGTTKATTTRILVHSQHHRSAADEKEV